MSEAELTALCAEWQKRLRLQDWQVEVTIKRQRDMGTKRHLVGAEVNWHTPKKAAWIRILDPLDYPPDCDYPEDQELSLVHELIHLHVAPWDTAADSVEDDLQEQAVHAISEALVGLKREAQVCGRSYDGKCPMPRPEPVEEEQQQENSLCHGCGHPIYGSDPQVRSKQTGNWHEGCYLGKNGPVQRREHEQIQHGRVYGGEKPYPTVGEQ